jgi:HAE1 family hydrophobic/amphiphilic exporter-1
LVVVALAFAAFAGGLGVMSVLQSEFFPLFDQGEFVVLFKTAPGASIDETRGRLDAVTATLKTFPEVERFYASIGAGAAGTVRDARVYIKLTSREEHPRRPQHEVERYLRQQLLRIPGIVSSLGQAASLDNRKLLLVNLRGEDISTLKQYSQRLKDALYRVPGVVDLEATLEHDMPEYRLIVDRERAFDIGVNSGSIAGTLGPLIGGQIVTTFEDEAGESRNVRVRLPQTLRADITHVQQLRVSVARPAGGTLVPIASVTRHELRPCHPRLAGWISRGRSRSAPISMACRWEPRWPK